ncbi:MAG: alpha/beta fold hydrolase [Ketobacteraceae bacterium]|nr:alpha/beta fold hydrolase [Ketobacteraceae bacterium]
MIHSTNKLFTCFYPNPEASHRLFCFPSAGGDATLFRDWYQYLPDTEVWGVTYPGRGVLANTPPCDSFPELAGLLAKELRDYQDKPVMFFGHSFGALISYELALQNPLLNPQALFVSARRAPHLSDRHGFRHMNDQEVLEKLKSVNSIPLAIAESPEILEYYLKTIVSDLHLNETIIQSPDKLDTPVFIYAGLNDDFVHLQEMEGWKSTSTDIRNFQTFEGDHFFIVNCKDEFLDQLSLDVDSIQGIED